MACLYVEEMNNVSIFPVVHRQRPTYSMFRDTGDERSSFHLPNDGMIRWNGRHGLLVFHRTCSVVGVVSE
jgi:hypothetical protein